MDLQKLRSYRFMNLAIFDLVSAFGGMILLTWLLNTYYPQLGMKYCTALLITIPIGIVVHYLLGIPTQLNYKLGLSGSPIQ